MTKRPGVNIAHVLRFIERYRTRKLQDLQLRAERTGEPVRAIAVEEEVTKYRELLREAEGKLHLLESIIGQRDRPPLSRHVLRFTGGMSVAFFCGDYLQGGDVLVQLTDRLDLVCPLCRARVSFRLEAYEVEA